MRRVVWWIVVLAALLCGVPAAAQGRAWPGTGQHSWSRVACGQGSAVARMCTGPGADVWLQVFPNPPTMVNVVTAGTQDEPEPLALPDGRWFAAYDQRTPYMHIEFRLYSATGVAEGPPVRIDTGATAWRPLAAVRPDGLIAVAYTADYNNRGYLRFINSDGTWFSDPILVSPASNHTDPACAFDDAGDLHFVWYDHALSSIRSRVFSVSSMAWDPASDVTLGDTDVGPGGLLPWPVARWSSQTHSVWAAWQTTSGVMLYDGEATTWLGPGKLPELAPPFVAYEAAGGAFVLNATSNSVVWFRAGAERPMVAVAAGRRFVAWQEKLFSGPVYQIQAFVSLF